MSSPSGEWTLDKKLQVVSPPMRLSRYGVRQCSRPMKRFRVFVQDNLFYCFLFGPACTKAGGTLWQGDRGEFDSRLVHFLNTNFFHIFVYALMAELVDAPGSEPGPVTGKGSSPFRSTI